MFTANRVGGPTHFIGNHTTDLCILVCRRQIQQSHNIDCILQIQFDLWKFKYKYLIENDIGRVLSTLVFILTPIIYIYNNIFPKIQSMHSDAKSAKEHTVNRLSLLYKTFRTMEK